MTQCLILTETQADAARGETTPGHLLMPIKMTDGNFVLPVAVLSDPAHEAKWPLLQDLPQRDVTDADFPSEGDD